MSPNADWYDPAQVKKGGPMNVQVPKIDDLLERDPYLKMHEREIRRRYGNFEDFVKQLDAVEGGIDKFAEAYKTMGCHVESDGTFVCLQWAPAAQAIWLYGDFNSWNKYSHQFEKLDFGKWKLTVKPDSDGSCAIKHLSKIKLMIKGPGGDVFERFTFQTILYS